MPYHFFRYWVTRTTVLVALPSLISVLALAAWIGSSSARAEKNDGQRPRYFFDDGGHSCVQVGNHFTCCMDRNSHIESAGGEYVCVCNAGFDTVVGVFDDSVSCEPSMPGGGGGSGGGGSGDPGAGGGGQRPNACFDKKPKGDPFSAKRYDACSCEEKAQICRRGASSEFDDCIERWRTQVHTALCKPGQTYLPDGTTVLGNGKYKCANGEFTGFNICYRFFMEGKNPCMRDGIDTTSVSATVGFSETPSVGLSVGAIDHGTTPQDGNPWPIDGFAGLCSRGLQTDAKSCEDQRKLCKSGKKVMTWFGLSL